MQTAGVKQSGIVQVSDITSNVQNEASCAFLLHWTKFVNKEVLKELWSSNHMGPHKHYFQVQEMISLYTVSALIAFMNTVSTCTILRLSEGPKQ